MSRKLLFFINPISGTRKKNRVPGMIEELVSPKKIPFEILPTRADGDYRFLPAKLNGEHITDIVVCGGDGTVNQLADAVRGCDVNIGIIPMGSGNGLALTARIPKAFDKAMAVVLNGKAEYIDGFLINDRFSCMLCGLGFDAQVAHDFAAQKKRGLITYIRQSTKNFFRARPYPFTLTMDGVTIPAMAYFISIANSNQFGNQFTIAPQASLQDGLLDIVVINKMNKLKMIWAILQQIRGGRVRLFGDEQYHNNRIHYFHAKTLQLQNPQMAPLHIDGDPVETAQQFNIRIIEKAFRLLMP